MWRATHRQDPAVNETNSRINHPSFAGEGAVMDMQTMTKFFMWCTIINVSLLVLSTVLWLCAADLIYKLHGRWFPMPRETFNVVFYSFMGMYKILVYVFNIVPWVALLIIG
jgi:hypothetical protein